MGTEAELRNVDRARAVDLQKREQRHVEATALEIGELMRRLDDGLGIGRAAELEIEQRNAADGALLDHPGDRTVPALLDQNTRDVGRNAESDVDGVAVAKLQRDATRNGFIDVEFWHLERGDWPKDLTGNRR